MKKNPFEKGQALVELVMLLFGFTFVFLGLIFVAGLSDGDLNALISARNEAERSAADAKNLPAGQAAEFGTATIYRPDIYKDSSPIDFSPLDKPVYAPGNTINGFPAALTDTDASNPDTTHDPYFLQAKFSDWKDMRRVTGTVFKADFVPDLATMNARGAADLVAGRARNINDVTLLNGRHHKTGTVNALYKTFHRLFGVRINPGTLENAPGNIVYMPAFSE